LKEKMIELLLQEPIGEIVAANAIAAVADSVLSRTLVRLFRDKCVQAFTEDTVGETDDLVMQFEHVAKGTRPINNRSYNFLFACRECHNAITTDQEISTIVKYHVLKNNLLSDSMSTVDGHTFLESNPDPTDPSLKYVIERLNGRSDIYRGGACLGGGRGMPLFWITPSEKLSTVRKTTLPENLGDAFRDLIGLIDREEEIPMVEIRFPGSWLSSRMHARPTFLDAGSHRRFKQHADSNHDITFVGWGWTVNLEHFANAKRNNENIDGVPERVVEPIDFNNELGATIKFVGFTKFRRGNTEQDDDAKYAERVCYGLDRSKLKKIFMDI